MISISRYLLVAFISSFLFMSCQPHGKLVATWPGSEDLAHENHAGRNRLFTGTAPRRKLLWSKKGAGRIEMLDLAHPEEGFRVVFERSVAPEGDRDGFVPVGLDVISDPEKSGRTLLYAANAGVRRSGGGKVSVFEIGKDPLTGNAKLTLLWETPRSSLLPKINGLTVARDGTIYASNFGLSPFVRDAPQVGAAEGETKGRVNTVVCFRPKSAGGDGEWKIVARGLAGANGLALTPDERHLLVCSYHTKKVHAFNRDPATGELLGLGPVARSGLAFHPDNLKAAGNHEFTVAGQRNTFLVGLQLFFGLPVGAGGGERFRWEPGGESRQMTDYTPWLKTDRHAPSTVIEIEGKIHVGHIVSPGVRVFDLPPR